MTHDAVSRNEKMNVSQRRAHNRALALRLADAGVAIFPSSGKTPLIPGWTKLDSATSVDEHMDIVNACVEKHDRAPAHVGATCDVETVKHLWRAFPDAVPSISCGANSLLVLDADTKRDGPAQLLNWAAQAGVDLSTAPTTLTQSGGLHVYLRNDPANPLGNAAGGFHDLGVDVRGAGGQVVAPGAIREDGRTYTAKPGAPSIFQAFGLGAIPPIPSPVRDMIAQSPKPKQHVSAADEAAAIERLATHDWPTFEELADSIIGKYDLDSLREKDDELNSLLIVPGDDHSDNRFTLAKCLHREYKSLAVLDFAALLEHFNDELDGAFGSFVGDATPGQGEFSLRSIARDFLRSRNCPSVASVLASEHFGKVEDDAGNDNAPPAYKQANELKTKLTKSAQAPLRLSSDLAANWKPTKWRIRNLLPETGIAMLIGDANIGKTFLSLDLAIRLDLGMSFDEDFRIRENVGVMYICGEGADSIGGRMRAWESQNGISAGRVLVEDDIDLFGDGTPDTTRVQALAEKTFEERLKRYKEATGRRIGTVFIDTLSSISPGLDENQNSAVKFAFGILRKLALRHNILFVVVHHSGLTNKDRARGASGFRGNADTVLILKEDKKHMLSLHADKQRDGRKITALRFRLRTLEVAIDEDGLPVTSCAVEHEAELHKQAAPELAVEDHDEAADLGEPPPAERGDSEPPISHKEPTKRERERAEREQRRAAEQQAKQERLAAVDHANSLAGRKACILEAAKTLGATFNTGALREAVDAARASSPLGLRLMPESSYRAALAELKAEKKIAWVSGAAHHTVYRVNVEVASDA